MLEVKKLCKNYNDIHILKDINFSVENGEIFGLLGLNGAGKSTLLSILAGQLDYTGEVLMDSQKLVYVPQKIIVFEDITVKENLEIFATTLYPQKDDLRKKLSYLCEQFSFGDNFTKKVKDISEGNKKKLNMAISFLKEGDIYLLDEPVANVDYESRIKIEMLLKELKVKNKTVVLVSHNRNFIESLCDKVVFLESGRQGYLGELNEEILARL